LQFGVVAPYLAKTTDRAKIAVSARFVTGELIAAGPGVIITIPGGTTL